MQIEQGQKVVVRTKKRSAGFRVKGYYVGPAKAGRVTVQLTGHNKQTGAPMTINSTYPAQFVEVCEW